jgi:hypothetical protein
MPRRFLLNAAIVSASARIRQPASAILMLHHVFSLRSAAFLL